MEVIVLSQFWTRTVVSAMSMTSPSASAPGTSIQSPICTMLFPAIVTPAVSPRMESLNMSISTADAAPIPART